MAAPWLNFPFDARVLLMQRMNVYTYTNVVYVYRKHIKSLYNTICVYICVYIYTYSNVMQLYGHIVFLKLEIVLYSLTQSYI